MSANLEPGDEVAAEIDALGRRFHSYRCDLADRDAVHRLVADLISDHPSLDILVFNAGTIERRPGRRAPGDELWDEVLQVDLTRPFVLARELGKGMLERGRGKIIFTASLLSFQGGITVPGYAASKGGVARLTKALANEWAGKGVNVNAIAPGYIATDNTAALRTIRRGRRRSSRASPPAAGAGPRTSAGVRLPRLTRLRLRPRRRAPRRRRLARAMTAGVDAGGAGCSGHPRVATGTHSDLKRSFEHPQDRPMRLRA